MPACRPVVVLALAGAFVLGAITPAPAQRTAKPPLHGRHWVAITGKPLAATAGAMIFARGGNAVDAAAAMLAATCTMWDVLAWGGETQALIYNPKTGKVIGLNALGVAPTGATPEFYKSRKMNYPPEYGPLAAVTPGTPGGLLLMLADYGTMSLADVLAPAIQMADGYPIERQTADSIERTRKRIEEWKYSRGVFLPHLGSGDRAAPYPGEIFKQPDLAATLRKLVDAEKEALAAGKPRKDAIMAAFDRFYRGDIADEFVRGVQEEGGLITKDDLARWRPRWEEPVSTTYKGIEVYKLTVWTQGPALLQALNILEHFDLKSMGYNTARYIHTLYQAMNLAFADRDFYYGDVVAAPEEPVRGLLSKEYAKTRASTISPERNDADARPGDPYPFQGGTNPYRDYLERWRSKPAETRTQPPTADGIRPDSFYAGTTSIETADAEGWVVSITPSGGWIPSTIAGRTGIGLSQRAQSFVLDPAENPFNVIAPGKQPRVTLTPTMALKDGKPYLSFAVQGGDSQDQNLLQFFLNMVEFGMSVQEAVEAPNINSFQMRASFGEHESQPGRMLINEQTPPYVRKELRAMGYTLVVDERTSGPIKPRRGGLRDSVVTVTSYELRVRWVTPRQSRNSLTRHRKSSSAKVRGRRYRP
jgi:gamma-glutamyltranspeptidase/glutathione hydrolase